MFSFFVRVLRYMETNDEGEREREGKPSGLAWVRWLACVRFCETGRVGR